MFVGDREVAKGHRADSRNRVADAMIEAKAGMSAQLEAFSANTIEFLRHERTLILDGIGVPELVAPISDRQVLVVAPGHGHVEDLKRLQQVHRRAPAGARRRRAGARTAFTRWATSRT